MERIRGPDIQESENPLSRALLVENRLYIAGTTPNDTSVHEIKDQTHQTLQSIGNILTEVDATFSDVVRVTVYLKDMGHKDGFNEVYREYFSEPYPTRAVIGVSDLGTGTKKMLLEIEAEAIIQP